ncbi:hypothetical protein L596_027961 [Steinernema carpocapsae]|uniref:Uncharacterized protein n=1 Tax=Steinernema carpocapsae TaxID=34508 RepID=A0A4U5LX22_STECR|nr:hypothetical protein L596_027961 [Steinernema carpocapsae]
MDQHYFYGLFVPTLPGIIEPTEPPVSGWEPTTEPPLISNTTETSEGNQGHTTLSSGTSTESTETASGGDEESVTQGPTKGSSEGGWSTEEGSATASSSSGTETVTEAGSKSGTGSFEEGDGHTGETSGTNSGETGVTSEGSETGASDTTEPSVTNPITRPIYSIGPDSTLPTYTVTGSEVTVPPTPNVNIEEVPEPITHSPIFVPTSPTPGDSGEDEEGSTESEITEEGHNIVTLIPHGQGQEGTSETGAGTVTVGTPSGEDTTRVGFTWPTIVIGPDHTLETHPPIPRPDQAEPSEEENGHFGVTQMVGSDGVTLAPLTRPPPVTVSSSPDAILEFSVTPSFKITPTVSLVRPDSTLETVSYAPLPTDATRHDVTLRTFESSVSPPIRPPVPITEAPSGEEFIRQIDLRDACNEQKKRGSALWGIICAIGRTVNNAEVLLSQLTG